MIPRPAVLERSGDEPFVLDSGVALTHRGRVPAPFVELADKTIRTATGVELAATPAEGRSINVTLDKEVGKGMPDWQAEEAYRLDVARDGKTVEIAARAPHGLFNGLQTLVQLANKAGAACQVPPVHVEDFPRFQWRGQYCLHPSFSKTLPTHPMP